jgi:hypothetical protein
VRKYFSERWDVLLKRQREAKVQAKWEKIASLPVGSQVGVNAEGYPQFPRGTVLEIKSFSTRGRKCVYGKFYSFDRRAIDSYDIRPSNEVDLSKSWDTMVVTL